MHGFSRIAGSATRFMAEVRHSGTSIIPGVISGTVQCFGAYPLLLATGNHAGHQ